MFKVGDRVIVVKPEPDYMCRDQSYEGRSGVVVRKCAPDGCDVLIDGEDGDWSFLDQELEAALPIVDHKAPTLLDQFAMSVASEAYKFAFTAATSDKIKATDVAKFTATISYEIAQAMMKAREVQK